MADNAMVTRFSRAGDGVCLLQDPDLPGVCGGYWHWEGGTAERPEHVWWYSFGDVETYGVGGEPVRAVTFTQDSTTVTSDDLFGDLVAGQWIRLVGDQRWQQINQVNGGSSLELESEYLDAGGTGFAEVTTMTPKWAADYEYDGNNKITKQTTYEYASGDQIEAFVKEAFYRDDNGKLLCATCAQHSPITSLTVTPNPTTVAVAGTRQLTPAATWRDANLGHVATFSYYSSNNYKATVDADGLITGVGTGTCTITVHAANLCGEVDVVVPLTVTD